MAGVTSSYNSSASIFSGPGGTKSVGNVMPEATNTALTAWSQA